jgi:hypothetical protein
MLTKQEQTDVYMYRAIQKLIDHITDDLNELPALDDLKELLTVFIPRTWVIEYDLFITVYHDELIYLYND